MCFEYLSTLSVSDSAAWVSLGQLHALAALFDELGNESRPPSLVARSDPSPIVAMEAFVEINEVAPVWIVLKLLEPTVDGASAFR
jgi:hypothetical protein